MKKLLFTMLAAAAICFTACGGGDEDAISDVIYKDYMQKAMSSGTAVNTGVYDVDVVSKSKQDDGSTEYEVTFLIVEHRPNGNLRYKGKGTVIRNQNGTFKIKSYTYW